MVAIKPTRMLPLIARLEEHPGYRMTLGLGVAVLSAAVFYKDALILVPSPVVGFRMMRLMAVAIAAYLAITWLVDLAYLYFRGLAYCEHMAKHHAWARRLPGIYRLLCIRALKAFVKRFGWWQVACAGLIGSLLILGLLMQSLAMALL